MRKKSLRIVEYQWSMIKLIFKVIRGIILLPVAVAVMVFLNHYEGKQIDTQRTVEGLYETN